MGWRKQVFLVGHNAEREAFDEVRDANDAEVGLEQYLQVELVVPDRVKLQD